MTTVPARLPRRNHRVPRAAPTSPTVLLEVPPVPPQPTIADTAPRLWVRVRVPDSEPPAAEVPRGRTTGTTGTTAGGRG